MAGMGKATACRHYDEKRIYAPQQEWPRLRDIE